MRPNGLNRSCKLLSEVSSLILVHLMVLASRSSNLRLPSSGPSAAYAKTV